MFILKQIHNAYREVIINLDKIKYNGVNVFDKVIKQMNNKIEEIEYDLKRKELNYIVDIYKINKKHIEKIETADEIIKEIKNNIIKEFTKSKRKKTKLTILKTAFKITKSYINNHLNKGVIIQNKHTEIKKAINKTMNRKIKDQLIKQRKKLEYKYGYIIYNQEPKSFEIIHTDNNSIGGIVVERPQKTYNEVYEKYYEDIGGCNIKKIKKLEFSDTVTLYTQEPITQHKEQIEEHKEPIEEHKDKIETQKKKLSFVTFDTYTTVNKKQENTNVEITESIRTYNRKKEKCIIDYVELDTIENKRFNIGYFYNKKFYGYYDGVFYKCENIKCRQYEAMEYNTFAINIDNIKYNDVLIDDYMEVESYGNCSKAFKYKMLNNVKVKGPYLTQVYENKIYLENNITFTHDKFQYDILYYDIETYNESEYTEVPKPSDNKAHIGIICYYYKDEYYVLLADKYKYDENKISELLENNKKVNIKCFDNETSMAQEFILFVSRIKKIVLLCGFNSSLALDKHEYKYIGYDMPFILEKSKYIYNLNIKRGVKIYNAMGGNQIISIDILPNAFLLDMSKIFYDDLQPGEGNKMENYKLDSYLMLNNIKVKLEHNYEDLQYRLCKKQYDISDIIAYCCYDCEALERINTKRNIINKSLTLLTALNVPFNYIYNTLVNNIKCYITRTYFNAKLLHKYDIENPTEDAQTYEGAYTVKPNDIYQYKPMNTIISDFTSLYPNTIIQQNISPETIEYEENEDNKLYILQDSGNEYKIYYKKQIGIIPKICKEFLEKRMSAKAEAKKHPKGSDLNMQLDCLQLVLKLIINSIYGLMGSNLNNFLYNKYCAMSVTHSGRQNIKCLINYLEENKHDIIFVDTDSACYENTFKTYEEFNNFDIRVGKYLKDVLGFNMEIESELYYKSLFINKKKCHMEYKVIGDYKYKFFEDINNNTVDISKLAFSLKGISWSNMTTYAKTEIINFMKSILLTCNNIRDIKNAVDMFIDNECSKFNNIIINKKIEELKNYAENVRISGAKNKLALKLKELYNIVDSHCLIISIKSNLKNKCDRVMPLSYITPEIFNKISIKQNMESFTKPIKKYFDYKSDNLLFEKYNFTTDNTMIKLRCDALKKSKNVYKVSRDYLECHINELEKMIKKNKNKSYNELLIKNTNKLFFDIEYTDTEINIKTFITYLITEVFTDVETKIHIASACKPNKQSYHIICDILCTLDYNNIIALNFNKKYHNICDLSVYKINKTMRLINTPKICHTAATIEHRLFKIISPSTFIDFCISYTNEITTELTMPLIYNNMPIHQLANIDNINHKEHANMLNKLTAYLNDHNITYTIKQTNKNLFHILTMNKFYCDICLREHESDNLYAYYRYNYLYIGCYRNNSDINKHENIKITIDEEYKNNDLTKHEINNNFLRTYINKYVNYRKEQDKDINNFDWSAIDTPSINLNLLDSVEKMIFIKSGLGTAKTTCLKNELSKVPENKTVLVLSFRITFSNDFAQKFNYVSYKDITEYKIHNEKYKRLVLQVDSLLRYDAANKIDYLILDEVESILTQLNNMNDKNRDINLIIQKFNELLESSNKIICMDGLLERSTIEYMKYITGTAEHDINFINNVYKNK